MIHGDIDIHDDIFTARENSRIIAKRMQFAGTTADLEGEIYLS